MAFEHYIYADGKQLRCGYTTGTCAALAASGAVQRLLTGVWPETVSLRTPKGLTVEVPLEHCRMQGDTANAVSARTAATTWTRPRGRSSKPTYPCLTPPAFASGAARRGPGDEARLRSACGGSRHQPRAPAR